MGSLDGEGGITPVPGIMMSTRHSQQKPQLPVNSTQLLPSVCDLPKEVEGGRKGKETDMGNPGIPGGQGTRQGASTPWEEGVSTFQSSAASAGPCFLLLLKQQ